MATIRVQNQNGSAPAQEFLGANSAELTQVSDVSINLDSSDIALLIRQGNDLIITLTNGEQILLGNFFVPGSDGSLSRFFISDNGALKLVQLEQSVESGLSSAEYVIQPVTAQSDRLVFAQENFLVPGTGADAGTFSSSAAGMAGAGLGTVATGLVGGATAIGVLVNSTGSSGYNDLQAPITPTIAVASGTVISGIGEPSAMIGVDTNGDGTTDLITTVAPDGTWSVVPSTALADGTNISVIATDANGNEVVLSEAIDAVSPIAPTIAVASGTVISGIGEPSAMIGVDTNGDGTTDLITTVAPDGTWSVVPSTALADETNISVTQTDPSGNVSSAALATIDAIAPNAPTITADVDSAVPIIITGTSEVYSRVTVEIDFNKDGVKDATYETSTRGASESWSVNLQNETPISGSSLVDPEIPSSGDVWDVKSYSSDSSQNTSTTTKQSVSFTEYINNNFTIKSTTTEIHAGKGFDTVKLSGDIDLDLTDIFETRLFNVEHIDLTDFGNNTLTVNETGILNISNITDTLLVSGNVGDALIFQSNSNNKDWVSTGYTQIIDEQNYLEYAAGIATILVDNEVQVII